MPTPRRCTPADAEPLSALATRLFVQAYGAEYAGPDLESYLAKSFGVERLAAALADTERVTVLVAQDDRGEWIGYALMSVSATPPPSVAALRPIEIERFYVDSAWHGRGTAQQLMGACMDAAMQTDADAIWLSAWQEAPRAQAFYKRSGFRVVGTTTFHFGARVDDDYVMLLSLDHGATQAP